MLFPSLGGICTRKKLFTKLALSSVYIEAGMTGAGEVEPALRLPLLSTAIDHQATRLTSAVQKAQRVAALGILLRQ